MIRQRFGTFRGLVRLALSYPQVAFGLSSGNPFDPAAVRRLVFVCQGNICRSAFAEAVARRAGLRAVSVGLSTTPGRPAHPPAIAAAQSLGYDLQVHSATDLPDYKPQPGDLLLVMEVRQLARLSADPRLRDVPRTLLGRWTRPMLPHLHDPYGLDDSYMMQCLTRIERAVARLSVSFPGARLS